LIFFGVNIPGSAMASVLSIDAAWTAAGSSGVALLRCAKGKRDIVGVAPSYAGFIGLAEGTTVDWDQPIGGAPDVRIVLK
jgi:hypothetical protein